MHQKHPAQMPRLQRRLQHRFAHLPAMLSLAWVLGVGGLSLGAGMPAWAAVDPAAAAHAASLPLAGLFRGDQLSDRTKARLSDLIRGMQGSNIEVAVMVPTGPWVTERGGHGERDLNKARMTALRAFLADRGIEAHRVSVESGLDARAQEPRLDVQLMRRASH